MELRTSTLILMAVTLGVGCALTAHSQSNKTPKKELLRVGVYDSRAIVLAYTYSAHNDNIMVKKSTEKKEAEQAGDVEKARQIDAWMNWFAIHRHAQGFGTEPVHDLLACVQKKIPQIAQEAGVDILVSKWEFDYRTSDAAVVDVTDNLARAFDPEPGVFETIEKFKTIAPLSYEEIVRHELEGGH